VLWESSSSKIAQVGLVEDENRTTKFTNWMQKQLQKVKESSCKACRRTGTKGECP